MKVCTTYCEYNEFIFFRLLPPPKKGKQVSPNSRKWAEDGSPLHQIKPNFVGGVKNGPRQKPLTFGGDPLFIPALAVSSSLQDCTGAGCSDGGLLWRLIAQSNAAESINFRDKPLRLSKAQKLRGGRPSTYSCSSERRSRTCICKICWNHSTVIIVHVADDNIWIWAVQSIIREVTDTVVNMY